MKKEVKVDVLCHVAIVTDWNLKLVEWGDQWNCHLQPKYAQNKGLRSLILLDKLRKWNKSRLALVTIK